MKMKSPSSYEREARRQEEFLLVQDIKRRLSSLGDYIQEYDVEELEELRDLVLSYSEHLISEENILKVEIFLESIEELIEALQVSNATFSDDFGT
jgi:hypothetical protein